MKTARKTASRKRNSLVRRLDESCLVDLDDAGLHQLLDLVRDFWVSQVPKNRITFVSKKVLSFPGQLTLVQPSGPTASAPESCASRDP